MNKQSLITGGLLFCQVFAGAQNTPQDSTEQISQTDIELVYNQYLQDGNNSAVTGGIGTEELQVYGPQINGNLDRGKAGVSFSVGGDLITSASTDKIDFIPSSASSKDIRSYANATYHRETSWKDVSVEVGGAFSMESDYLSLGAKLGIEKDDAEHLRTLSAHLQVYRDDLRWGRLSEEDTLQLIYPIELSDTSWHEDYIRNSINLKLGWSQVLNKRNIAGVYPELTYQQGLLSTPFHRIYFSNNTQGVERFPRERFKGALALRLNTFAGGRVILKNAVEGYADNFGIVALALENETIFKLRPDFSVMVNARGYTQTAAAWFKPIFEHSPTAEYYTSDWDFSAFTNYQFGLGIHFKPFKQLNPKMMFKSVRLRYYHMRRSNGLTAHMFSLALQARWKKKSGPK